uniref:Uncharacterized protein n=2 Tax=Anser TaxID=8842 RepID=A0A8B9CC49_9AVES
SDPKRKRKGQPQLWLHCRGGKIFGNQPIPQYEVNAQTIDILYKPEEYSGSRDRDISLLIEGMEQRAAEYEADGELEAPVLGFITVFLSELVDFFVKTL